MSTIYQDLEAARTFGDTMRLRDRIMAETTGSEQAGYLKSLDCLEEVLDQMAGCYQQQADQAAEEYIARNYDECGNPI